MGGAVRDAELRLRAGKGMPGECHIGTCCRRHTDLESAGINIINCVLNERGQNVGDYYWLLGIGLTERHPDAHLAGQNLGLADAIAGEIAGHVYGQVRRGCIAGHRALQHQHQRGELALARDAQREDVRTDLPAGGIERGHLVERATDGDGFRSKERGDPAGEERGEEEGGEGRQEAASR